MAKNENDSTTWCFFDLDGTLIRRDSFPPLLSAWLRKHPARLPRLWSAPFAGLGWLLGLYGRGRLKESLLTAVMKGARRNEVEEFVPLFWERFLRKNSNSEAVERLFRHHEQGHRVYIITASFDFYALHLKSIWPVEGVIATRAAWEGETLTGKMLGGNCRGETKLLRIEEDLGVKPSEISYYAYSDSKADSPLMRHARWAFHVRRGSIRPWKRGSDR